MKVCIVTEGTAKTGYGHLTRCLAIYQGFEEKNISPTFVANCDVSGKQVLEDIQIENFEWIGDSERLLKMIHGSEITLIDSYLADLALYDEISKISKKCVYLDDTLRLPYPPGVIINGAAGAEDLDYQKYSKHQLLLGLEYTPLRKAFWDIPTNMNVSTSAQILIVMGSKNCNKTSLAILTLLVPYFPFSTFALIVEKGFEQLIPNTFNKSKIIVYSNVSAIKVRDLMLDSKIIITAGGQSLYESLRFDAHIVPIETADNQHNSLMGLKKAGFVQQVLLSDDYDFNESLLNIIVGQGAEGLNRYHQRIGGEGVRNIINRIS